LNGVSLEHFDDSPPPDFTITTDASDVGLCAIVPSLESSLTYEFSSTERALIHEFHQGATNEFDINYRELLACTFAAHAWASTFRTLRPAVPIIHVDFRVDNTTAISWQSKMTARNTRAQTLIRLLSSWEVKFGLRFSSSHIPGATNIIADAGSRQFTDPAHTKTFVESTRG
jgi:hypothetical protein